MGYNILQNNEVWPLLDGYSIQYALEKGKNPRVTIVKAKLERIKVMDKMQDEVVIYFDGWGKGMKVNKTNQRNMLRGIGSPDIDDWVGASATLSIGKERAAGVGKYIPVELTDIRPAPPAAKPQKVAATKPAAKPAAPQTDAVTDANASLFGDEPSAPPVHPDF